MGGTISSVLQNPGLLQLVSSLKGLAVGNQPGERPPAQAGPPAQVGATPPAPTPPQFGGAPGGGSPAQPEQPQPGPYNTGGTQGALPMPVPRPPHPGAQPIGNSDAMMSKLAPKGAGAYQAIQGVQQVLGQWAQRKEGKESAEASNIANNLMTALQSNDVATVHEILNDPHSTKVLNKVYKGWLTKDQQAQKQSQTPSKPPDPTVQGFESGIQKFLQNKQQVPPQGGQQPPQQPPQGQQPPPQGTPSTMPRSVGGYLLPQAGPAQLDARAKQNANISANQADPRRMIEPTKWDATPKTEAEMATAQAAIIKAQTSVKTANVNAKKADFEMQKSQADYNKALLGIKSQEERASFQSGELNTKYQTAIVNKDIKQQQLGIEIQKLQNLKQAGANIAAKGATSMTPKISQGFQVKFRMLQQAETTLKQLQASGGKIDENNVAAISQALKSAGAVGVSKKLDSEVTGASLTSWFKSYSTPKEVLDDIDLYKKGMQSTFNLDENWMPQGKGSGSEGESKTAKGGSDLDDMSKSVANAKPGDVVNGFTYKGGDKSDVKNWSKVEGGSASATPSAGAEEPDKDDDEEEDEDNE
jgi:hypothetical protein